MSLISKNKNNLSINIMLNNNIYYTTTGIYGVKIYTYNNRDCTIIFKQQLNTLMSDEMIEKVKSFYDNLDENSKKNLKFQIYRNCKSIENKENCMIWLNISLNKFITDFSI
jgi:hypothetical protein